MSLGLGLGLSFGGAHAFTPKSIGGLVAWYRADLGASVSTWADQSGNGYDAVQATGSNQFAHTASGGANGQAYYTVTGAGSQYMRAAGFPQLALPFEVFAVVDVADAAPAQNRFLWDFQSSSDCCFLEHNSDGLSEIYAGAALQSSAFVANTATLIEAQFQGSSNGSLAIDGGTAATGSVGPSAPTAGQLNIGGLYGAGGNSWGGRIYELVFFNALIASGDRTKMIAYLKTRYGIA